MIVPEYLLRAGQDVDLRILATSGLATGVAETTVKGSGGGDGGDGGDGSPGGGPGGVIVTLLEDPAKSNSYVLRAIALDAVGRQLSSDWIHWHDALGGELARGPTLDTRSLPAGRHTVRAVFADPAARRLAASGWLIERGAVSAIIHHAIQDKPRAPRSAHTHPALRRRPGPAAGQVLEEGKPCRSYPAPSRLVPRPDRDRRSRPHL